jgi:NADH-quinone oxidoreductase subunit K
MLTIGLMHYLVLSAFLLCCGIFVMSTKRNAVGILIGVELVLNSAAINFVAFDRYRPIVGPDRQLVAALDGHIATLFIIVLAAAEAAIAVAICMNVYKNLSTVDVDQATQLQG